MNNQYNFPYVETFLEDVDQWHKTGYTLEGNLIYSYFVDRKDPQYEIDNGVTLDAFLANPSISEKAKKWLKELMKKYPSNNT